MLSPLETKLLYAQGFGYSALAAHEIDLFPGEPGKDHEEKRKAFLSEIASVTGWDDIGGPGSVAEFLISFHGRLAQSLQAKYPDQRGELSRFLQTLIDEISSGQDVAALCQNWLEQLRNLGRQYLNECRCKAVGQSLPEISLGLDANENLSFRVEGSTTADGQDCAVRRVTLFFNPQKFSSDNFFSIPSVLFHEFWCHCLSDLGGAAKSGCDPSAAFEEGWMHYTQSRIFEREIDRMVPGAPKLSKFKVAGEEHTLARGKSPTRRAWGFGTASAFLSVLYKRSAVGPEWGVDPEQLFFQLSLDLNTLSYPQHVKNSFVDALGRRLQTGQTTALPRRDLDKDLVLERQAIPQMLSIRGGLCNIEYLLNSLILRH